MKSFFIELFNIEYLKIVFFIKHWYIWIILIVIAYILLLLFNAKK